MTNYRVNTNTNSSSNKTTQEKTNKNNKRKTKKQGKMESVKLLTFKRGFLKISVDLQTALPAETHPAIESCKVTYVPSGNTNADSFQDRGAIFSVTKGIY
jgi:hypothetical protein